MLALTRVKVPLGLSLMLGGITLNLWSDASLVEAVTVFGRAWLRMDLWLLLAITVLVVEFGRFMTERENADNILNVIRKWGGRHGRAWSLMAVPAVVGLIPMPAGALFSAPLVQKTAEKSEMERDAKAAINYWFRHIWEYWWPLYPGVIVAMSLFEMENWQFFASQIPFTIVAVFAGFLALVRTHVGGLVEERGAAETGSGRGAAIAMVPLLLVIVSVLVAPPILDPFASWIALQNRKMIAMLIGLLLGLFVIVRADGARGRTGKVFSTVLGAKSRGILLTIAGVMVFKHCLDISGLIEIASREMENANISPIYAVMGLPFLAGMITGIAVGFAGAALPVVVGLVGSSGSGLSPMATLVLAYGCGYMGMMMSPLHLCVLVTRDYFDSSLWAIWRKIVPCVAMILAYAVIAHVVFRALGW